MGSSMSTDPTLTQPEVMDVDSDADSLDVDQQEEYSAPVDQLLTLGDLRGRNEWHDYHSLGLTEDDIPALLRMAMDEELNWSDSDSTEVWAPIHAWRALGQLRAEAAVQPLLNRIEYLIEIDDEWVMEDMPTIFGMIGPPAVPALTAYLSKKHKEEYAPAIVAESMQNIAVRFPESREQCVASLMERLEHFYTNHEYLNASLISDLTKLQATEALPLIERAFAADRVDEFLRGDWEDVEIDFGLKETRDKPPRGFELIPDPTLALLNELETIQEMEGMEDELEKDYDPLPPSELFGPSVNMTPKASAKKSAKRKQAAKSRKVNRKHK
jgi:hypothetical protein